MRTNEDDEQRSDDRAESVAGVGDAESTTTPVDPRSNEQGDEREVDAAESDTQEEDRREEPDHWTRARPRTPRAP